MKLLPPMDWNVAIQTGSTLASRGPKLTQAERVQTVVSLREIAQKAHAHAVEVSQLADPGTSIPIEVVGRARWIELQSASAQNVLSFAADSRKHDELSLAEKVQSRVFGAEAGAVFAVISTKLIGQFDPFATQPALILLAPNILEVEKRLDLDPQDFRMWVCVHEQTHRLQFARASWLKSHLQQLFHRAIAERIGDSESDREYRHCGTDPVSQEPRRPSSLIDVFSHPQQRESMDSITAVMSVLEGYAEVMMNRVGAELIPSVSQIKAKFAHHRQRGGVHAVLRKALGMDAKMAQYRDGANFCAYVINKRSVAVLNRVYDSAAGMPTYAELMQPERWLNRRGL